MYEKYLHSLREKTILNKLSDPLPLKSIFRTFPYDGVLEFKKQKDQVFEGFREEAM